MSRPTVVTVTETPRNPGSYEVNVERDGKMVVGRARAGSDPGAAAAKAMQMAMEWGARTTSFSAATRFLRSYRSNCG